MFLISRSDPGYQFVYFNEMNLAVKSPALTRRAITLQPIKDTADYFSQFEYEYAAEDGPFQNLGTIVFKADNGRYVAPSGGTTIKPLANDPHKFLLMPARITAERDCHASIATTEGDKSRKLYLEQNC